MMNFDENTLFINFHQVLSNFIQFHQFCFFHISNEKNAERVGILVEWTHKKSNIFLMNLFHTGAFACWYY